MSRAGHVFLDLTTSFKDPAGIFKMPPQWIPDPLTADNYIKVWEKTDLAQGFVNSLFFAVTSTTGEILTSTLAGYAFARIRFRGRRRIIIM